MRQYERETYYDTNGRIVFTPSKGLVGVGLDRKAKKDLLLTVETPDGQTEDKPLGWEDAIQLPAGSKIHRTVIDNTLPGGPREKTITYQAPWHLPNSEEEYRVAWQVFSERFAVSDTEDVLLLSDDFYPGGRIAAELYCTLLVRTVRKYQPISQDRLRDTIDLVLDAEKRSLFLDNEVALKLPETIPQKSKDYDLMRALNSLSKRVIRRGKDNLWEICSDDLPIYTVPETDYVMLIEQSHRAVKNMRDLLAIDDQVADKQTPTDIKGIK